MAELTDDGSVVGESAMRETTLDAATVEEVLTRGELDVEGRLVMASNVSFVGTSTLSGVSVQCVYKPVAGERPLWDFPDGTLADRERAARIVSEVGGWGVVPPTVLREGRFGRGMVQQWVEVDPEVVLVDVVEETFDEPGWIAILEAEDRIGNPVLLVHADDERLRAMAVMDVVLNNADRKGGHVLPDGERVWGCDHGITFHREVKLRTVLWGWADEPLRAEDVEALERVREHLDGSAAAELGERLTRGELSALRRRVTRLLEAGVMPSPNGRWPAIPWPAI
jgi:uncharacterized repeat protein (TIGR03843 family)